MSALFQQSKSTLARRWRLRREKRDHDSRPTWPPRLCDNWFDPVETELRTVVGVRLDKKSPSILLLIALDVKQDGQKVLLAVNNMGGESEAAWRTLLGDLIKRGLNTPELDY